MLSPPYKTVLRNDEEQCREYILEGYSTVIEKRISSFVRFRVRNFLHFAVAGTLHTYDL